MAEERTNRVVLEALGTSLLLAILSMHGVQLIAGIRERRHEQDQQKELVVGDKSLVVRSFVGVSQDGSLIKYDSAHDSKALFVVLHDRSVREDVVFWKDVMNRIPQSKALHLFALCSSPSICGAVNPHSPDARFSLLLAGEVLPVQAVFNADKEGNAVLVSGPRNESIPWRAAGASIEEVVKKVAQ